MDGSIGTIFFKIYFVRLYFRKYCLNIVRLLCANKNKVKKENYFKCCFYEICNVCNL